MASRKCCGILLWIAAAFFIALGIIIGYVLVGVVLHDAFANVVVYSPNSKFDDPTYEDCKSDVWVVYFFNLTNPTQVLAGLAIPHYEEVGPYNFTWESCKFNVTHDDKYEYFNQYWKDPVLEAGQGTDKITNFNPAYLGLMRTIGTSNPEFALETNFVSGGLELVISGMQAQTFYDAVEVGGIPTLLELIQSEVVPQIKTVVRAGAAVGFIGANLQSVSTETFFNEPAFTSGISNIVGGGSSLGFSNTSQEVIFFGNVSLGQPPGWLTDASGKGLLYFLQTAVSAGAPALAAAYGVTGTQFTALATYASTFLLTVVPPMVVPGGEAGINATAFALFLGQWANATLYSNGLDIFQNGHPPAGFEVGSVFNQSSGAVLSIVPSGISLSSAYALWDPANVDSIVNPVGIAGWFNALTNTTKAGELSYAFGLGAQVSTVLFWLYNVKTYLMPVVLLQQFQIASLSELAYIQWGSAAVLQGASIFDFQPSVGAAPEFAVFAQSIGSPLRFDLERTHFLLLNPATGFLANASSVPNFFAALTTGQFGYIQQEWNLTVGEATVVAGYLQYFISKFVDPIFLYQLFPAGGGLITSRTPKEWIWTAEDPLLTFIHQPNSSGMYYDSLKATSRAQAELFPLRNNSILLQGGDKEQVKQFLEVKTYFGLTKLDRYSPPVPLYGNDGGSNFQPFLDKTDDKDLFIFSTDLARTVPFVIGEDWEVEGITLFQYSVNSSFWESAANNSEVAPFYQTYTGLLNISSYQNLNVHVSRPHFYGVDPVIASGVTGLDPTGRGDHYANFFVGVEPQSGVSMALIRPAQLNFEVPTLHHFYPNQVGGIFPIAWRDEIVYINSTQAADFNKAVNGLKNASIASYVLGPAIGVILFVVGFILITRHKSSGGEKSSEPIDMEDLKTNS